MNESAVCHPLAPLSRIISGAVRFDEPLARHCSWQVGGPADALVEPETAAELAAAVRFANERGLPLLVIGQGTNLLFADAGLRGIVLKIGCRLGRVEISGTRILAEAGVWVPGLALQAARAGLSGLEHTIGIPGTLGGLVAMNGGSRRRAIGENVRRVWVIDGEGETRVLDAAGCCFAYRSSSLQGSREIVVRVELELTPGDRREMRRDMLADLRERRRKFPRKGEPNCGSVFLSSAEMHATVGPPGRIIEEAGLKGAHIGGIAVSSRHANFLINRGGATAADILAMIAHIRRTVRDRIGYDLRCEVRYVNDSGAIMPADRAV